MKPDWEALASKAMRERNTAWEEVRRLREDLHFYGQHTQDCATEASYLNACTCGLDKALEGEKIKQSS